MNATRRSVTFGIATLLSLGGVRLTSAQPDDAVRIAVTTSFVDSGLLDHLTPRIQSELGIRVFAQSLPTDIAINLAEAGRAELVIGIRSRSTTFRSDRKDTFRISPLMSNEFILVGPPDDPGNLREIPTLQAALREIARMRLPYISRADNSGTHFIEREFWAEAGVNPKMRAGKWFVETGLSMGRSLGIAASFGGHILTDKATWLSEQQRIASRLTVLVDGRPGMTNEYDIMLHTGIDASAELRPAAVKLYDWLVGPEGQSAIAAFRIGGEMAFRPSNMPMR